MRYNAHDQNIAIHVSASKARNVGSIRAAVDFCPPEPKYAVAVSVTDAIVIVLSGVTKSMVNSQTKPAVAA